MKIEKIYLIDKKPELCAIWSQAFDLYPEVVIIEGDYFQQEADAIVSPANSFGIMDGGLDLAIRNEIGFKVEDDLQSEIIKHYHGELPIGSAIIVPTNHSKWSYLISAPTMRIPENVEYTFNAYYAFRAILLAVNAYNRSDSNPIRTLVCCGLGTGIGGMSSLKCAGQMRIAYKLLNEPARIASYDGIHKLHETLRSL